MRTMYAMFALLVLLANCSCQQSTHGTSGVTTDATYQAQLDTFNRQATEQDQINQRALKLMEQQEADYVRTAKMLDEQDAQSKRIEKYLDEQEAISRRFDALLAKQEEQLRRQDAILDADEKRLGIKRAE